MKILENLLVQTDMMNYDNVSADSLMSLRRDYNSHLVGGLGIWICGEQESRPWILAGNHVFPRPRLFNIFLPGFSQIISSNSLAIFTFKIEKLCLSNHRI